MDELGSIALVLEGVVEEGISHADFGELGAWLDCVLQLLLPHPVARVLARHYALVPKQLVDDVDVVNDVQDERLDDLLKKSLRSQGLDIVNFPSQVCCLSELVGFSDSCAQAIKKGKLANYKQDLQK